MIIKKLRAKMGVSQAALAAVLGVSRSTVCLYESGKRTPDKDALIKMADFFGVSVDCLLGRKETDAERLEEQAGRVKEIYDIFKTNIEETLDGVAYLGLSNDEKQLFHSFVKLTNAERALIRLIAQLNDEETETLSKFVDFIISQRK